MILQQVVYAKTDVSAGSQGITAFIIEKGMPGYLYLIHFYSTCTCLSRLLQSSFQSFHVNFKVQYVTYLSDLVAMLGL